MQNNASSGGVNSRTRKIFENTNTLMATMIPIMVKAYVRALQRNTVIGESAK